MASPFGVPGTAVGSVGGPGIVIVRYPYP
jgi:hypothetical protein